MKNKDYSKWLKFALVLVAFGLFFGNNSTKTLTNIGGVINSSMVMNTVSEGGQMYNSTHLVGNNATAYTQCYADDYTTAAADTAAGGFNHTGILTWKNNRWENA